MNPDFGATDDDRKIVVRMESPNLKLTEVSLKTVHQMLSHVIITQGKMLICSSARIPVDSGFIGESFSLFNVMI